MNIQVASLLLCLGLISPGHAAVHMIPPPAILADTGNGAADISEEPIVMPEALYSQQQTARDITELKSRYGSLMKVYAIGKSLDGRTIFDIVVGDPSAEKKLLVTAAIHGREYITIPIGRPRS